eukprot:SAG22_NODE_4200_length_1348_cov_1.405925_2_plen_60_part_01
MAKFGGGEDLLPSLATRFSAVLTAYGRLRQPANVEAVADLDGAFLRLVEAAGPCLFCTVD